MWFPEGYWAEREFRLIPQPPVPDVLTHKNPDISKGWKRSWRRRSGKSGSGSGRETESHDDPHTISPRTVLTTVIGTAPTSPQSPFLSEEAHVHSLQHPESHPLPTNAKAGSKGETEWLSPSQRILPHEHLIKPLPEEARRGEDTPKPRRRFASLSWRLQSISAPSNRDVR